MTLYELAVSSCFRRVLDLDTSFLKFMDKVDGALDVTRPEHREYLLCWLNEWGCRQFARDYHERASQEIRAWFRENGSSLPLLDSDLVDMGESQCRDAAQCYGELVGRTASIRSGGPVVIGPTGASKILFAVRPRALPPWDNAIMNTLGYDGLEESFLRFLLYARQLAQKLAKECTQRGFGLSELPGKLGRSATITVPKLIDEYHWITITRNVTLPTAADLKEWLSWSRGMR